MTVTLELRRQGVSAQLLPSTPLAPACVSGRLASLLSCRSHT